MDGAFYLDLRSPFTTANLTAVTLSSADKALYTAGDFPVLGGQYFNFPGKALRIKLFGRMTTGATPGNLTWSIYFGTGADANGTILAASTATALVASGTALTWEAEIDVHCRTTGASGTLFCTGRSLFSVGLVLSTNAPILIPGSTPVVSSAVDLTAANIISVQAKRSGSTGESMQVHNMQVVALN